MKTTVQLISLFFIIFTISCSAGDQNIDQSDDMVDEAAESLTDESSEEMDEMEDKAADAEREITVEELPSAIVEDIQARYSGAEIEEADEISHSDGSISYEVEIETVEGEFELEYSQNGEFMTVEQEDEEEEEDDDEEEEDDHEGHDHD